MVCLQVLTAEQQRAFCRICAIVRGFLVRRLLKTEKVKNLRQTIVVRSSARKHDYSTEADKNSKNCKCAHRTRRSLSAHFRLKQSKRGAPTRNKISLYRSESEPRYDCSNPLQTAEVPLSLCLFTWFSVVSVACSPV